jgi:RHS repeat-associated protein
MVPVNGRANVLNAFAVCAPFRDLAGTLYRETFWLVSDRLGTPRMVLDKSGSLAGVKRHDYLPFGEELYAGTGARTTGWGYTGDSTRQKFTGYEADGETGLNFAQARYQSPGQGRFTSVDPLGASASVNDPQSFNRYSYVNNNPVNFVDPTGMALADIGVVQTTDPSLADTLQQKSNADWMRAINADYAHTHGGRVMYDANGHASFISNRASAWARDMARDTAAQLTNSMFGGSRATETADQKVTFMSVSLLSNTTEQNKIRTVPFDQFGGASLDLDTATGPDVWRGEAFTIRVSFNLPFDSKECCTSNSLYENDVRLDRDNQFRFASVKVSPTITRSGFVFYERYEHNKAGGVDITLKRPVNTEGKSNKIVVIVGGLYGNGDPYHGTANIRLVVNDRRRQ